MRAPTIKLAATFALLVLAPTGLVIANAAVFAGERDIRSAWKEAITHRDAGELIELLDTGVNVDLTDDEGVTALMVAARHGQLRLARRLINAGASIAATNHRGGTALMYAAQGGNRDLMRLLISQGAEIDAVADNGWTALIIAAAKGHAWMVDLLLRHGADPNRVDVYGWSALMRAADNGDTAVVKRLLEVNELRIDATNEHGMTALHQAAARGHEDILQLLLAACADPTVEDAAGRTVAELAEQTGHRTLAHRVRTAKPDCPQQPQP